MLFILLVTALAWCPACSANQEPLKPLGAHIPCSGHIEVRQDVPEPAEFFHKYSNAGRPVLMRGAALAMPAYTRWQDSYLAEQYGDLLVEYEGGKKENRSYAAGHIPLREFLAIYQEQDVYLVHDVPVIMHADFELPFSLRCGGYEKHLNKLVMWFSSGGTRSVLHNDAFGKIPCIQSIL